MTLVGRDILRCLRSTFSGWLSHLAGGCLDSGQLWVWQAQGNLAHTRLIQDVWSTYIDCMQGTETWYELVPTVFRIFPQSIWLWDPGIQLDDWSLYFLTSRFRAKSESTHSWFDIWTSTEAFLTWQGQFFLLLLRIEIDSRWIDIDIMEMPKQDELGFHRFFTIRFQERRIQSAHDGQFVIVRVVQCQHGGTLLILALDLGITGFHGSVALGGDLVPTRGGHLDLPLGFCGLLLVWGTSPAQQVVQHGILGEVHAGKTSSPQGLCCVFRSLILECMRWTTQQGNFMGSWIESYTIMMLHLLRVCRGLLVLEFGWITSGSRCASH